MPIEPASKVQDLCNRLTALQLSHGVRLELQTFRETRTPHDARRLANALRYVDNLPEMAAEVERAVGSKAMLTRPCGAKTRAGHPCKRKGLGRGGRCLNHGGMSTGPKTHEGRERIAAAQRSRWRAWREAYPARTN